jgi:uncharacterized protein (DUF1697 family)
VPSHLALLRGINVGGRNRVAMAELRRVVAALGHTDVATYIQSGNVVFTSADPDAAAVAAALERAVADDLGVPAAVVVLDRAELAAVVAGNPFPGEPDPKRLHVVFTAAGLDADAVAAVATEEERARERGGRDEVRVRGRVLYLRTPDGLGRSELATRLARPAAGVRGTTRNWATVAALLAMLVPEAGSVGSPP